MYSLIITDEESHVSNVFRYGWLYQEEDKVQSAVFLFNYMYMVKHSRCYISKSLWRKQKIVCVVLLVLVSWQLKRRMWSVKM